MQVNKEVIQLQPDSRCVECDRYASLRLDDDFQRVSGTLRAVNEKSEDLVGCYSQTTKYSVTQLAQSLKFKPSHDPIRGKQGGDTTVLRLRRLVSKWLKSSGPPTQIGIVLRCFT